MADFLSVLQYWVKNQRPMELRALFAHIRVARFDGSITIHFRGGIAQKVEAGRPLQVDLYDGGPLPAGTPPAQPLTDTKTAHTLPSV